MVIAMRWSPKGPIRVQVAQPVRSHQPFALTAARNGWRRALADMETIAVNP